MAWLFLPVPRYGLMQLTFQLECLTALSLLSLWVTALKGNGESRANFCGPVVTTLASSQKYIKACLQLTPASSPAHASVLHNMSLIVSHKAGLKFHSAEQGPLCFHVHSSTHGCLSSSLLQWEEEERATQRQTVKKREERHTSSSRTLMMDLYCPPACVCVCTCVCVGMTSQACQADGVPKVGQEERCSICCLARVNIMAHWPTSCRHCALSHRDAKTRSTRRSSRFAVRVICSDSRWSVLIFEPSVY